MKVSECTIEQLDELIPLIQEFYSSTKMIKNFNFDHCRATWIQFIQQKIGTIFLLMNGEKIEGFLAALKFPDVNTGQLWASEMAWFVGKEHRGKGIKLLEAFEQWAKKEGCTTVAMVYLMDSMPDKLKDLYLRRGYSPIEIHYMKEL